MRIRTLVVMCAAIGAGATLTVSANQVVVAPSPGSGQGGSFARFETKVLKGQPYSAETVNESIQTLSDGNRIVHRTTGRVYRDVEGRTRREEDRPSASPTISISDPVASLSWTLNPDTKTARETAGLNSTFFSEFLVGLNDRLAASKPSATGDRPVRITGTVEINAQGGAGGAGGGARGAGGGGRGVSSAEPPTTAQVAPRGGGGGGRGGGARGGSVNQRTEEQLPNKSIENLLCSGVRRTTTIPAGSIGNEQPIKIVSEEWTSIDLQVLVLTDLNDPRSGRTTYKLVNVRRADPDLTLFKVPADYTITRGPGGRGRGGN